ncbi:MAG TPA: hypothetical protein VF397_04955 [Pyrinomonadaceae bacterium]
MQFDIPLRSQFAAITINPISISAQLPESIDLGNGRYIVVNPSFEIEDFWRRQLGGIKSKRIADNSVLLLVTVESDHSDGSIDRELIRSARSILYSLFLQGVYFSDGGTVLCGSISTGRMNIRSVQDLNPFVWPRETVTALLENATVNRARTIADGLESMYIAEQSYRRLKRGFHSYLDGIAAKHEETRMRHFVRSIEAFIRPAIGKTRSHFVHRGQLFVGSSNDMSELLGELYGLRSCAEHMNDIHDFYAGLSESEIEKRTAMGSFQSEVISNYTYRRVFETPGILKHFISDSSIKAFWEKPIREQKEIWGEAVNVSDAIKERFNPYL